MVAPLVHVRGVAGRVRRGGVRRPRATRAPALARFSSGTYAIFKPSDEHRISRYDNCINEMFPVDFTDGGDEQHPSPRALAGDVSRSFHRLHVASVDQVATYRFRQQSSFLAENRIIIICYDNRRNFDNANIYIYSSHNFLCCIVN